MAEIRLSSALQSSDINLPTVIGKVKVKADPTKVVVPRKDQDDVILWQYQLADSLIVKFADGVERTFTQLAALDKTLEGDATVVEITNRNTQRKSLSLQK